MVLYNIIINFNNILCGYFRVITTVLNITFEDKIACSTCWLMLVELIPNGMYVDVYQTKEDESFGGPQVIA